MFFVGLLSFVVGLLVGGLFGADKIDAIHPGEGIGAFPIFWNNFKVGMSLLFFGMLSGSAFAHIILFLNGLIVGQLIHFLIANDMSVKIVYGLLPHMGCEVCGLAFFAAVSCIPIAALLKWLHGGDMDRKALFSSNLKDMLKGVSIGTLLLLIAALIECYISSVS